MHRPVKKLLYRYAYSALADGADAEAEEPAL